MIVGHELIHRKEFLNKIFGTWLFTKVLYSHWYDEHTKGYHENIGTPLNSASALREEIFFHFFIRS